MEKLKTFKVWPFQQRKWCVIGKLPHRARATWKSILISLRLKGKNCTPNSHFQVLKAFSWSLMVKVRGRISNRNTAERTNEKWLKISGRGRYYVTAAGAWRQELDAAEWSWITWPGLLGLQPQVAFELVPADHKHFWSVALHCMKARWNHWRHKCSHLIFFAVCLTIFLFKFRPRIFTIALYEKIYQITAQNFGVQFFIWRGAVTGERCVRGRGKIYPLSPFGSLRSLDIQPWNPHEHITGSAEALSLLCVRCTRWERERERERDGSDVTIVELKLAMSLHSPLPKVHTFRFSLHTSRLSLQGHHCRHESGNEFTVSLAKKSQFSFLELPSHFSSLPSWSPLWRWNSQWVHTFRCPKNSHSLNWLDSLKWREPRDEWSKTQDKRSNPAQS